MNKRRKNGSLLFGIIFIALAINMLLSQLKILDINIFNIVLSFILMSYGIYALIKRNFTFGFLGILFGLKISSEYYQDYVDFSNINNFTIFLIAILLGFGFTLIFGNHRKSKKVNINYNHSYSKYKSETSYDSPNTDYQEYLSYKTTFSEDTRYIYSHQLKEADFDVSMGSMTVFFQDRNLSQDLTLNLYCKMGNLEVYLPREWRIVDNLNVTLGNIDIDNYEANPTSLYTVTLQGNSILGNIEIHYI